MPRKKNNKIPPLLLVLICACLLFAMYVSVSTIALGLWGSTVMGTVNSYDSRLDDTDAGVNRSRTVSKGYSFTVNGKEYRGYVIYVSDEAWPRLSQGETRSERISYFPSFPYINKPSALTDFDQMGIAGLLYHLLSPLACLFLLLLVSGTIKGKKKTKKAGPGPQANGKRSSKATHCLSQGGAFSSGCGVKIPAGIPDVCMACGADLPDDVEFCTSCGTAVNAGAIAIPSQTASPPSWQSIDGNNASLVGFSQRYNLPEILAAAQKNKKTSLGCMAVLVFVPLIGFPLAGLLIDEFPLGEALVIGVGVALAMLVVNLFALGRTKRPIWEGTVVNKYSKERSEHRGGDGDNYRTYTEFTTVINTDAGKKKTIVEKNSGRYMYDYLAVGDRVRFHPMFGTYEKYDKSKDRIIYCNVCSMMNPIQNDRCKRCTNLLFK